MTNSTIYAILYTGGDLVRINKAIQKLRRAKKITQSEAAEQLGVSLSAYQKYERDKDSLLPSLEMVIRMADFYGTTTDFVLGRKTDEPILDADMRKLIDSLLELPEEKRNTVVSLLLTLLEKP